MLFEEKAFCSNSIAKIVEILDGWAEISEEGGTIRLSEIESGLTKIIDLTSDLLFLDQTKLHSNSEDVLRIERLKLCSERILQQLTELLHIRVPPNYPLELSEMKRYENDFESLSGKLFLIWQIL